MMFVGTQTNESGAMWTGKIIQKNQLAKFRDLMDHLAV